MILNIKDDIIRPVDTKAMRSVRDGVSVSQRWRKYTKIHPTNGRQSITIQWANDMAGVKEWKGHRQLEGWGTTTYNVSGKKWENSVEFDRDDIGDPDQRPYLIDRVPRMVNTFFDRQNAKWFETLLDTATLGPDGVPLFSTAHPVDDSKPALTNSNLITGTGVTEANIVADFQSVMTAILNWQIRSGDFLYQSLDNLKLTIIHRTTDFNKFKNIFINNRNVGTASATEGQWQNMAELWPTAYMDNAGGDWIVIVEGYGLFPILQIVVHNLMFEWNKSGDSYFNKNVMAYGGSEYYNMVPGYWQAAVYVNN